MSLDLEPERDGNGGKCNNFSSSIPTKQQKSECCGLMINILALYLGSLRDKFHPKC